MNARYPNLELLEYKARVALSSDEEFLKTIEEQRKNNKYVYVEMEAIVFPQIYVLALMFQKMEVQPLADAL